MTYTTASNYTPVNLKNSNLFQPLQLNDKILLKHRVCMAPLTRFRADDDYVPNKSKMAEEYYKQRASAEGTLIITEGAFITEQAGGLGNIPGLWTEKQLSEWSVIFKTIHDQKSFVFVQLWNLGRQADPIYLKSKNLKYLSASNGVYMDEKTKKDAISCGNELQSISKNEIKHLIQDYVKSTVDVIAHGADGVEIHSANGYFLNQFLDPVSNKRTDEYGGSIENRSRLVLEIVDAIVSKLGEGGKVGIRFSPYGTYGTMSGGSNPLIIAQYSHIIGELEKRAKKNPKDRLAYIHLVEPRVPDPNFSEGSHEYLDGTNDFVFSIWKGTVIRAGNYALDNKTALRDVDANNRTILAYGRYFISNPDLVARLENQWPLTQYDRNTFYAYGKEGYTDYPFYND